MEHTGADFEKARVAALRVELPNLNTSTHQRTYDLLNNRETDVAQAGRAVGVAMCLHWLGRLAVFSWMHDQELNLNTTEEVQVVLLLG